MIRSLILIGLLALGGCAHELAECRGPLVPLNASQWQPTAEDLKQ